MFRALVPLKYIEYGFGHVTLRSPYTPYPIYLRGTIAVGGLGISALGLFGGLEELLGF